MYDLSTRQLQILKHIVREYIDSAEPVGSETLEKKFDLGISPATIRNEMAEMSRLGYLAKPHSSAGRIPTSKSLKLYVNELMKQKDLTVAEEVEAKEGVWDLRENEARFLRALTRSLSQKTHSLAVATNDTGDIFFSGYANILDMPEFYDIDITKHLLDTLDEFDYWWKIFSGFTEHQEDPLRVFVGEDLGSQLQNQCGGVFIMFSSAEHHGAIGVVGPTRLNYPRIIPLVRYMGNLINNMAKSW